jgi:hypothetical protein
LENQVLVEGMADQYKYKKHIEIRLAAASSCKSPLQAN